MRDSRDDRDRVARDELALDARPLAIALHGAVANAHTWRPLARLVEPRIALDAYDFGGHGTRRGEPFDLAAEVDALTARIAAAAPRRVALIGDSLGGYVALLAAAQRPPGLCGVVAAGCTYVLRGTSGAIARTLQPDALLLRLAGADRVATWLARGVHAIAPLDAAAIVAGGLAPEMRAATLRALDVDILAAVRRIAVPVIYAGGAFDPARAHVRRFLAATPQARSLVVPRAGHGIGLTHPAPLAAALDELLR